MKTKTTLLLTLIILASGCASLQAARGPNGEPITLEVTVGQVPGQNNAGQIDQVLAFMQPDLEEILGNAGYAVVRQPDPGAFVPGPNRYSLVVQVTNYNPGSKAARMLVGFGAGTLVLDSKVQLFSAPGQVVWEQPMSVGSSRDWDYAARKTNVDATRAITNFLSGGR